MTYLLPSRVPGSRGQAARAMAPRHLQPQRLPAPAKANNGRGLSRPGAATLNQPEGRSARAASAGQSKATAPTMQRAALAEPLWLHPSLGAGVGGTARPIFFWSLPA